MNVMKKKKKPAWGKKKGLCEYGRDYVQSIDQFADNCPLIEYSNL